MHAVLSFCSSGGGTTKEREEDAIGTTQFRTYATDGRSQSAKAAHVKYAAHVVPSMSVSRHIIVTNATALLGHRALLPEGLASRAVWMFTLLFNRSIARRV